jgi:hypothetical protein
MFRSTCLTLFCPKNGGSSFLRNFSNDLLDCMALYPNEQQSADVGNLIKSRNISCVSWLETTDVPWTISAPVTRIWCDIGSVRVNCYWPLPARSFWFQAVPSTIYQSVARDWNWERARANPDGGDWGGPLNRPLFLSSWHCWAFEKILLTLSRLESFRSYI